MDNAVKFINEGGRLTLRVHPEGTFCAFSISNTGAGISAEELPHVFDRFYKADRSRSLDKTGAGLGLYIVKNIINLHGGEISVRSTGKPSSRLRCRWPRRSCRAANNDARRAAAEDRPVLRRFLHTGPNS